MISQPVHNLPAPRTSLIGRDRDVVETRDLLLHHPERLVTLTGVGGCGKTRLALQVVAEARDAFSDGVWLIDLAPIADPLLVPRVVAAGLGIREAPGRAVENTLIESLEPRALLLVLDNCEHLIDACAGLADQLLSTCPNLRILATSREPLQIAGERQRRVLPLAAPDPDQSLALDELARYPAVQLFVERAGAVQPHFHLSLENARAVVQICSLLAGIPLALELAAARVSVLAVGQIAERLDDCFALLRGKSRLAPTRQQTLKAALDWSYDLLPAAEQTVFRQLAALAGNWTLAAAAAVCPGATATGVDLLDVLTRLVDKSLVMVLEDGSEARYRLLEPVRQYAQHQLAACGEVESAQAKQAAFCIALAERAEPELQGSAQVEWLHRLDCEFDNIRATVQRAEQRGDAGTILRLAGALYYYFWMRRHLREGLRWFEAGLALAQQATGGGAIPAPLRAKGLFGVILMLSILGENTKALALGSHALTLCREVGDSAVLTLLTVVLAQMSLAEGKLPDARAFAEQSVRYGRQADSPWRLGHALIMLGQVLHRQGERAAALALHEEAGANFQQQGDRWGLTYAAAGLAALHEQRPDVARVAALSSVRMYWELGDYLALAAALEYLALQGEKGHAATQVTLFAAAQVLRRSRAAPLPPGERDGIAARLATARIDLGAEGFAAAWAAGSAMSLPAVIAGVLEGRPLDADTPLAQPQPRGARRRPPHPPDALTPREWQVARLAAGHCTDRQIAEALTITEGTAGLHVHHILQKLGLRSRAQIADWAQATGLIDTGKA
jgi:non-specific serine/threonine protein kinase